MRVFHIAADRLQGLGSFGGFSLLIPLEVAFLMMSFLLAYCGC